MKRSTRWVLGLSAGLGAAVAALGLAFVLLVPSNEALAALIASRAEAALGVKVTVGAVRWQLMPPALTLENLATVQPQPIRLGRLVAQPRIDALWRRQLVWRHVLVEDAVLPQLSLRSLRVRPTPEKSDKPDKADKADKAGEPGKAAERGEAAPALEQLRFRNLTWITRHGRALEFDGQVVFDADGRPRQADMERPGVQPVTRLALVREGEADRWKVELLLGGGTANGEVVLKPLPGGRMQLSGQLEPRNVEVAGAMAAFKRHSALRGKASGRTVLSASGEGVAEIAQSLHTRTLFSMAPATLVRLDIDKAIRSAGLDREGQTSLQSLTGQMDTQNTPGGIEVRYSAIEAKGETFSATGGGSIVNRRIDAEVKVDLVGGLIGVPLKVTGPLDAPKVSVPASSLAGAAVGAAVGTAVLPGVGTAVGASVGAAIGRIFTGDKPGKAAR